MNQDIFNPAIVTQCIFNTGTLYTWNINPCIYISMDHESKNYQSKDPNQWIVKQIIKKQGP